MNIEILFEDDDIVVIHKPAGVVTNQAATVSMPTIQQWFTDQVVESNKKEWTSLVPSDFESQYGTPEETFQLRQGIVHRLDKDTSGVMILAKNPGSLVNLLAQFKQRTVAKQYTCLVHGKFRVPEGTISAPLERASFDRQQFTVSSEGRPAETLYKVQQDFKGLKPEAMEKLFDREQRKRAQALYQGFSLTHCWPKTGRTHQIRVHLKHWKHPIVGDGKYVGKKRAHLDQIWVHRQFLHASELSFNHPRTQERMVIQAPLAEDLQAALALLEAN
jgi:23S rRNA pseudouridine1911/1915/1917 synthase